MTERADGYWLARLTPTEAIAVRDAEVRGNAMARIAGEMTIERAKALAMFGKA